MSLIRTHERFTALDSLRGIAALTVVVWHLVLLLLEVSATSPYYPAAKVLRLWQISPLYPLMAGREAVIIFFILSGFVLSLPWIEDRETPYRPFLIKRICRIYIPYLVAVILAFLAYAQFGGQTIAGLAGFIGATWSHDPSIKEFIQHFLLVGSFDNVQYDLVLWSLVQELRVSIIFPLLMILVIRWHWLTTLIVFLSLSLVGTYLTVLTSKATDYPATMHYLIFFVSGALIAKHRLQIVKIWRQLPKIWAWTILGFAFLLYAYSRAVSSVIGESYWSGDIEELLIGVGAGLLIIWLLASVSAQRFMAWTPLVFLGRISYSLYLLHPIILLSLVHALAGRVNIYILLLVTLPLSIVFAWVSYRCVEKPSMKLGRHLASREERRKAALV